MNRIPSALQLIDSKYSKIVKIVLVIIFGGIIIWAFAFSKKTPDPPAVPVVPTVPVVPVLQYECPTSYGNLYTGVMDTTTSTIPYCWYPYASYGNDIGLTPDFPTAISQCTSDATCKGVTKSGYRQHTINPQTNWHPYADGSWLKAIQKLL